MRSECAGSCLRERSCDEGIHVILGSHGGVDEYEDDFSCQETRCRPRGHLGEVVQVGPLTGLSSINKSRGNLSIVSGTTFTRHFLPYNLILNSHPSSAA